jgi:hypothetical protein
MNAGSSTIRTIVASTITANVSQHLMSAPLSAARFAHGR